MTLDEAIMHSLELVDKYKLIAPGYIVRENQQLADWLIELREFRKEFTNARQARRISELMKTAIADLSEQASCSTCRFYFESSDRCKVCYKNNYEWRGYAEAIKMLGGNTNEEP